MSRSTWDTPRAVSDFEYGPVTLSGGSFQNLPLSVPVSYRSPATPRGKPRGLGCSPFARHYSGNRLRFLFLGVLRCFTSPGIALKPYFIRAPVSRHDSGWVSPFGHLRINACLPLPGAYRSLLRPSSPADAKASTMRPFELDQNSLVTSPSSRRLRAGSSGNLVNSSVKNCTTPLSMQLSKNHPPAAGKCSRPNKPDGMGVPGVEPGTSSLSGTRSNQLSYTPEQNLAMACPGVVRGELQVRPGFTPSLRSGTSPWQASSSASPRTKPGGGKGVRTPDPELAKLVLFQLSYAPSKNKRAETTIRWTYAIFGPEAARRARPDDETSHGLPRRKVVFAPLKTGRDDCPTAAG